MVAWTGSKLVEPKVIGTIGKEMKRGCPQGSSLGTLLWNLYQNYLSSQVSNANLNMYANDHQLSTMGSNAYSMKARLEPEAA